MLIVLQFWRIIEIFINISPSWSVMDTSVLEELGLTNAGIKVYLALLELGTSTAGPILRKTGLQNSVVHLTLNSLVERRFVSFVMKGRTRYYAAADPRSITRMIDAKRRRYEALLPALIAKQKKEQTMSVQMCDGADGLNDLLLDAARGLKRGDDILLFPFSPELKVVYDLLVIAQRKRGVVVRTLGQDASRVPVQEDVVVIGEYVFFTPWDGSEISFVVRSARLAASFRKTFEAVCARRKR
jgi:predicted transcriptional regulator